MDRKDRQDSRFLVNISALRSQVRSPLITTQSARTEVLQVLHHRRAFTTRSHITIRRSLLNLLRSEDHSSPEQFLSLNIQNMSDCEKYGQMIIRTRIDYGNRHEDTGSRANRAHEVSSDR